MQPLDEEYTHHHQQDKVRIRSGEYKGQRGIIHLVTSEYLEIQLQEGKIVQALIADVTNQSLAARKAWRTMKT